ncbi:hypothetical protein CEY16_05200 [Halalkalibacillus sediminis]|uniref:Gas vesicle protein GvpP n=1 Tax=Halalkalibacillus sediminis TaxID=2018042 RepID=A0A2I0QYG1_9BACI|nr:hypothetical protein [Halalkalibacillus sediminis]PKR79150.1 hypothetical protein CEY16_05200 [Halalkalibacillus sediminis]
MSQEQNQSNDNYDLTYAVVGSVVGTGVGLLSTTSPGKKVIKTVAASQIFRVVSSEFTAHLGNTVTQQVLSRMKNKDTSDKTQEVSDEKYEELKNDYEKMDERLSRIENMLQQLTEQSN